MTPIHEDEQQLRIDLLHNEEQLKRKIKRQQHRMIKAWDEKDMEAYCRYATREGQMICALMMKNYFAVPDENGKY